MIKDSGNRRDFGTGAVRDIAEGKGRCDLLPLYDIGVLLDDDVLIDIGNFMQTGIIAHLHSAIRLFCSQNTNSNGTYQIGDWLLDYSKHMEEGCLKYGERNWQKGIPLHCYIDSGVRHYLKLLAGWTDEPHDRAFIWNLFGCLWTLRNKPEMNDLPFAPAT